MRGSPPVNVTMRLFPPFYESVRRQLELGLWFLPFPSALRSLGPRPQLGIAGRPSTLGWLNWIGSIGGLPNAAGFGCPFRRSCVRNRRRLRDALGAFWDRFGIGCWRAGRNNRLAARRLFGATLPSGSARRLRRGRRCVVWRSRLSGLLDVQAKQGRDVLGLQDPSGVERLV
jgi:hypothetical protein